MTSAQAASAEPTSRVVAVTGTSEFLGSRLVGRLEQHPGIRKILSIDVREPVGYGRKTRYHQVDLTLPEAGAELRELFRAHRVDLVAHLAFLQHPIHDNSYAHELQVIGTLHVLNAAAAARVPKLVVQGSTLVYGARPANPNFLTEDRRLRRVEGCPTVNDLVEVEQQLARFAEKHPEVITTSLRFGPLLGPEVDGVFRRLLARPVVPTVMGYDPLLQFLHQDDALQALLLAIERDVRGPLNIVADGVLPLSTILRLSGRLALPIPYCLWDKVGSALWALQAMDMPISFVDYLRFLCVADGARARHALGFVPRHTTRQALLDFVRHGYRPLEPLPTDEREVLA